MAHFFLELPTEVMRDVRKIYDDSEQIFSEMTRAGAEVVQENIKKNVPKGFHDSNIMSCLKLTRPYHTPSDGGINTKVAFVGYFYNSHKQRVPAPLVCNIFEYGRSGIPFKKQPFMRKSFRKDEIEKAMLRKQRELSGGLLDE